VLFLTIAHTLKHFKQQLECLPTHQRWFLGHIVLILNPIGSSLLSALFSTLALPPTLANYPKPLSSEALQAAVEPT
jgi:hypothetical protein